MKKAIILFIAIFACCLGLRIETQAQTDVRIGERLHIQTDKDNYLSGELMWMKLLTTDDRGLPLSFSKVGYVELTDESGSVARERIDLRGGIGDGTLLLPSSLPTGYYRLTGYTRHMRNEGSAVFFDKWIGVVNPVVAEVRQGTADGVQPEVVDRAESSDLVSGAGSISGLTITTDGETYSPRSEVRVSIGGLPADVHTMSVSVTAHDMTGRLPAPTLGEWLERLPQSGSVPVGNSEAERLEAEYEGPIVTGRLVSTDTGAPVLNASISPLISFTGDDIDLFPGRLDRDGGVIFFTSRTNGTGEVVTTMRGDDSRPMRIDVDDPFTTESLARPTPTFPVERIDSGAIFRQSLAMQLRYSYSGDSLNLARKVAQYLFAEPDYRYIMEEWRRFATMQEVVTEFIQFARFHREANGNGEGVDRWHLSVINSDFGNTATALVMVDGIPVFDHGLIRDYNPLLIDRIDVYYDRFVVGSNIFHGVVALYTATNTYPELRVDPFTQIASYPSPQPHRMFYAPDYTDAARRANRLPDYRHTLYWDADVAVEGEHAEVVFSTSDLTGSYRILIEGMTVTGEPFHAIRDIEVSRNSDSK
ncbi:MAG: hypothetical protein LBV38_06485 [Alistipes sp.]|jgi:hypothetical protein|nr:hypothetical protein [Alistipes sp.]